MVTQVVGIEALDSQITQLLLVVVEVLEVLGERVLLMVLELLEVWVQFRLFPAYLPTMLVEVPEDLHNPQGHPVDWVVAETLVTLTQAEVQDLTTLVVVEVGHLREQFL